MKLKYRLLFGFGWVAILLLVSCQSKTELTTPTATEKVQAITLETVPAATQSATVDIVTTTPVLTLPRPTGTTGALTPPSSQAPLSTESVPVLRGSPVIPTSWPTLSPDEAANRVLSLLHDNHNPDCLLPCWWGAVPGQTHWRDISPYFESFALEIHSFPEQSALVAMFPVAESIDYRGKLNIGYGVNISGLVTDISVASVNIDGYDPRTLLTIYGVPDEVWLQTHSEILPGEVLPFQLIIVYQEQGISFRYYVDAATDGEMVTTCFEPGAVETERPDLFPAGPRIYLWEPGLHKTIDEIANIPEEIYYPLEEKTDMTLQTFYDRFIDPNERPCIDTPADLWE